MACRNVLFFGFAGLGDTLLVTPALSALRDTFPGIHVSVLVVPSGARDALENNPCVDEIVFEAGLWRNPLRFVRLIRIIRKMGFDAVVTVYPTSRILYNLLAFLSGAPERIVHDYPGDSYRKLSFLQNVRVPLIEGGHSVLQNIKLLEPLGLKDGAYPKIVLNLTDDDVSFAGVFLSGRGFRRGGVLVGFHPGSGGMEYKRWPLPSFLALADRLREELGVKPIFFCGPSEKSFSEKVRARGFNVFEGSSLGETAALIARCALFVSNDSALMHVAVSQDVPVAAVFGPTDPAKTGPYTTKKREVTSKLSCSPCYDPAAHRRFSCTYGESRCLEAVSVDEVFDAVKPMLKVSRKGARSK
ncbi:MAG: glycosyltransferase family 9 protein [Methanobacteriota archaeon]